MENTQGALKPLANNTTEQENEFLRTSFDKDQRLLKVMRAVMLNLDPTTDEKELVRSAFQVDELYRIVRKKFLPTLEKNAPIGQVSDVWLGVEQMVFGMPRDTIFQAIQYKKIAISLTEHALGLLRDPDGSPVDISYDPESVSRVAGPASDLEIWLLGRNQFLRHVESQLSFLDIIIGQPVMTPAQKEKAAFKDSSK